MNHSPVESTEILVRFIYAPFHIRKSDGTIRWQAFKPAHDGTSVTRQKYALPKIVLQLGEALARFKQKYIKQGYVKMIGKAEVLTQHVRNLNLDAKPAPSKRDPNHANIIKWPPNKDAQIMLCKELIVKSKFIKR